jgi:hypothetical protein
MVLHITHHSWPDLRQVMQLDLEVQRDISLLGSAAVQCICFPEKNEPETLRLQNSLHPNLKKIRELLKNNEHMNATIC